ncbi:EFR1 family ferrodoxin [Tindallia californiensis]|uniref:4Fe-4S binding domain-containing protein n=1 Tax=Tindallia californiensis TaxID=159292 RepID=A0A1H3QP58_9FIRM|nr:EFR1 family ferrodoxin [Tindallia californiensis]SDZ15073.1 4Fe-4S binding domain-containing protein [Tindallia californiensis]
MAKIFYFSGTGNSYQVAKKLGMKIDDCELIKMTHDIKKEVYKDDMIGIVFPVYYFGLPKVVDKFLINFESQSSGYLFVIATRGIPFAGGVRKQLMNIFSNKISYFQYITMGDNFNIDFWNSSSNKVKESRNSQCDDTIQKIAVSINKRVHKKKYTLIDFMGFITRRFPRYGYETYINKVYGSDECFNVNTEICTGCNKCVTSCPVDNIRFDKQVKWMHKDCQLCLACYHCCPTNAIQYTNGHLTTIGKSQYWNYF